ncbi:PTS glucose transporter subunit IIA [Enterococcus faecium]
MFGLKRKTMISTPVVGITKDLVNVNDPVFSQKLLGDGVAVVPEDGIVVAPISGEITALMEKGHAFGITAKDGLEIVVHIGVDTVNLEEDIFLKHVKLNQKVTKGTKIIEFDLTKLKNLVAETSVMVIATNLGDYQIKSIVIGEQVALGDKMIECEKR